jgi:SAM-dependent methyltransferase
MTNCTDLQHHLFVMTMDNKLHLAPISENVQNVLDIGTGTGIWAIEFGRLHSVSTSTSIPLRPPSRAVPICQCHWHRFKSHPASIVSVSLSFSALLTWPSVPPNCSFRIDDAEDEWVYPCKFDFIHGRALISCFKDPAQVVSSIYAHLNPGGYFEFQDPVMPLKSVDGTLNGTSLDEWQTACMAAAQKLGRPWTNSKNYGKYMADAGFVDIVDKQYYWATNQWVRGKKQKLQARWLQENLQDGLAAWGLSTLSRGFGWSRERIEVLLAKARNDLKNPNIHAYAECYVVYGRKPE